MKTGFSKFIWLGLEALKNVFFTGINAVRGLLNLIVVSAFEIGINILWTMNELIKFLFDIK
jgi:hypothetical protein